jgi:tripartite-type tricarboxylate transporter receptor subunit TctC
MLSSKSQGEIMRPFASNNIVIRLLAALASILAAVCGAGAADYPNRVVTLVVPYPPGGGVDAMARVVAAKLSDAFKQQVIDGVIGRQLVDS